MDDNKKFTVYFETSTGQVCAIKRYQAVTISLTGIATKVISRKEKDRVPPPDQESLLIAKIDFLYALSLQFSKLKEKEHANFESTTWEKIAEICHNPQALRDFLISEKKILEHAMESFFNRVVAEVDGLKNKMQLLEYRRQLSRTYALGGLFNLMTGDVSDT